MALLILLAQLLIRRHRRQGLPAWLYTAVLCTFILTSCLAEWAKGNGEAAFAYLMLSGYALVVRCQELEIRQLRAEAGR